MAVQRCALQARRPLWLAVAILVPTLARAQLPADVGQWTAPVAWPQAPVHMTLQPDGMVVMWPATCGCVPGAELNGGAHARVWDPVANAFSLVPNASNVFCAGHVPLADGRTLTVGGHINYWEGIRDTTIFNGMTWTRVADMAQPRWYPSAVRLADGRVLAISGNTVGQTSFADVPEVYDPMMNTWLALTGATLRNPDYSFLFVLPGGTVLNAGPDRQTRRLNVATSTWIPVGDSLITAHSAVQYSPGRIMKAGTFGDLDNGVPGVHARTVVLDMGQATPQWRETAPMAFARAFHTMTLLPDGTALVTGGDNTGQGDNPSAAVNAAELWNPATETWRTLAPNQRPRLYHSTALLLPDGRVVSAGGELSPYLEQNAEFFSPPYLFRGARPTITSLPAVVSYGSAFTVQTPNTDVTRVSLLAPASVTHGFDMNQRYLSLSFSSTPGSVSVQAPSGADLAPPGYYMLFLVNVAGVPSIGRFVQLVSGAPSSTTTTLAPSTTTTSTTPGASSTTTTAATTSTTTSTVPAGPGPVAAWAFDEGAGPTAADASGNTNNGTLAGATWTTQGRVGSALTFGNGTHVAVPDRASLDLTAALTLEAWVNPTAVNGYRMIVNKTTTGQPTNYYLTIVDGILSFGFYSGGWREHFATVGPTVGAWSHVAATYSDVANQVRLYLNGSEVLSATETASLATNAEQLRIGIGFSNEGFAGRIDEVRVYARALTAAEVAADMNRAVGGSGTSSTSSTSSTSTTSTTTSSTASSSSTSSTSTTSTIGTTSSTSSTSTSSTTTNSTSSFTTTSTSSLPSSSTTTTSTSSSSTSPPASTSSTTSVSTTSTSTSTSTLPGGLVAAYGFDEAQGPTVLDASGNGLTGTITGASRLGGRFGRSILFDGAGDWVNVPDAPVLDLTAAMTLEAWVYRRSQPAGRRTLIAKEATTRRAYFLDAVGPTGDRPAVGVSVSGVEQVLTGGNVIPLREWTHVAGTYDGTRLRLYVNGVEVASRLQSGAIGVSSGALRVGANTVASEDFFGRIDEVRIYGRALGAAEIQADMLRAVNP